MLLGCPAASAGVQRFTRDWIRTDLMLLRNTSSALWFMQEVQALMAQGPQRGGLHTPVCGLCHLKRKGAVELNGERVWRLFIYRIYSIVDDKSTGYCS